MLGPPVEDERHIGTDVLPHQQELLPHQTGGRRDDLHQKAPLLLAQYLPEPLGNYGAGPNPEHATSLIDLLSSAVELSDFVLTSGLIEVSEAGAHMLGEIASELAYGEGLQAHARSAEYRLQRTTTE
ncbi:histidinol dehydrogenase [Ralstonia solanacearum]|uniref:histidinol dehydrogenase n=1 Tax=Ralstonia solanacearum TaxID=305 RepID=UPI000A115E92|nr:histidinol dehydrogenase [Ralstonia solanacearum]